MLSSLRSGLSRIKRELLSGELDAPSASAVTSGSVNLSLVLASPDTPPKAQFDTPQGLCQLVALRNSGSDAHVAHSSTSGVVVAVAASGAACLCVDSRAAHSSDESVASAAACEVRGVVVCGDALACLSVPLGDAGALKRDVEQQLTLEYEALDDVRQQITAERERLRLLQLEFARDAARRDGSLAEFDAMRQLELEREAAARARELELGNELAHSPRTLRRERTRRRKKELELEQKRVLASRLREPVQLFRARSRSAALCAAAADALSCLVAFDGTAVLHLDAQRLGVSVDWSLAKCADGAEINVVRWLPNSAELFVAATTNGTLLWCDVRRAAVLPFAVDEPEQYLGSATQTVATANPTAVWRIAPLSDAERRHDSRILDRSANSCEILALEFGCGDTAKLFALTCVDGSLRFFATKPKPTFLCAARSDGGAFTCLAFAPSGRHVVAGGEADTISVYSLRPPSSSGRMRLPKLVAVCAGHRSFVRCVAFDTFHPARIVSGGDDCRLLFWDLQLDSRRTSAPAAAAPSPAEDDTDDTDETQSSSGGNSSRRAPAPAIAELDARLPAVPTVIPVAAHQAHLMPIVSVAVNTTAVVTCDSSGQVRVWARPESALARKWVSAAASE